MGHVIHDLMCKKDLLVGVVICRDHVLSNADRRGYMRFPIGGVLRTTHFLRCRPISRLDSVVESHLSSVGAHTISSNVGSSELLFRDKKIPIIYKSSNITWYLFIYFGVGFCTIFLLFAVRTLVFGSLGSTRKDIQAMRGTLSRRNPHSRRGEGGGEMKVTRHLTTSTYWVGR